MSWKGVPEERVRQPADEAGEALPRVGPQDQMPVVEHHAGDESRRLGRAAYLGRETGVGGTASGEGSSSFVLFKSQTDRQFGKWHRRLVAGDWGQQVLGHRTSRGGARPRLGGSNSFTPFNLQPDSHFGKWHRGRAAGWKWERKPVMTVATWRDHFTEFRSDGWPLCPRCGEDELWSPLVPGPPEFTTSVEEYVKVGLRCYCCGWASPFPVSVGSLLLSFTGVTASTGMG